MNLRKKRELERQALLQANRRKRIKIFLTVVVSLVIISVLVLYETNALGKSQFNLGQTNSEPQTIPWGSFIKVSNSTSSPQIQIYYISWYGCPIGATDSWAFYNALSHYTNMSRYITPNNSSPVDSFPNTPGLLFSKFSTTKLVFDPIYVYGEEMNRTISGVPFGGTILDYGMSLLQQELPSTLYAYEVEFLEKIPVQGKSNPSAFLSNTPHVNSNVFIVGPNGTYFLDGPLYSPLSLSGLNTSEILTDITKYQFIQTASSLITSVISSE